jgi:hypothetical protein
MSCSADRAAYMQVKDERISELAPSVNGALYLAHARSSAGQSAHRLTDLLTRPDGKGETT